MKFGNLFLSFHPVQELILMRRLKNKNRAFRNDHLSNWGGARKLSGENLKVVLAKFSTLS
jgi:hypothetical protein